MTELEFIHYVLNNTLRPELLRSNPTGLIFNRKLPYLTQQEHDVLWFILLGELRPRLWISKKTNSMSSLIGLIIPSSHSNYASIISKKGNFSVVKKSLISKEILYESRHGFMLNHRLFPFSSKKVMTELHKLATIPPPPPQSF